MNLTNAVATISKFSGTAGNKSYVTLATGVEVSIVPVSSEIMALYPDLPVGQSFSFMCMGDDLVIPPESIIRLTATDGEFVVGDEFIVRGEVMRQLMLAQYALRGICIRK